MMNLPGVSKAVLLWEASVLSSCQLPKENSTSSVIWSLLLMIKVAAPAVLRMRSKGWQPQKVPLG